MAEFDCRPDLVLLDSAGHIGFAEFEYFRKLLVGTCLLVLDDTMHVKHNRSMKYMDANPDRFKFLYRSTEKFGFCVAQVSGVFN